MTTGLKVSLEIITNCFLVASSMMRLRATKWGAVFVGVSLVSFRLFPASPPGAGHGSKALPLLKMLHVRRPGKHELTVPCGLDEFYLETPSRYSLTPQPHNFSLRHLVLWLRLLFPAHLNVIITTIFFQMLPSQCFSNPTAC